MTVDTCLQCFDTVGWVAGRATGLQKMGGWWRWALVSPDGMAPRRMVGVSAFVNHPLHHKVQKFSSGTGSTGWSRKKGHKTVVVIVNTFKQFLNRMDCEIFSTDSPQIGTFHKNML